MPVKFLIVDDKLRIGSVSYHRELLSYDDKGSRIKGGGIVEFENNDENKIIRFDGGSADYGTFKQSDIKEAITNTPDLANSLETLGKLVCGDDFEICQRKVFVRDEEINL